MAAIANLAVSVTARVGKFIKGMKRAGKRLKKFARGIAASAKRVAKFGFALGAVAAGGLALLTKRAFKSIDTLAKLSDSLGVTTENLAALQHAAEITGVGTEAMNKALKDFVRRIGEAQAGMGEAKSALDAMSISANELADVGLFEAFVKVAEGINKLPNAAARAEASYRLFGRQGVALTNTLAVGRKGLEAFRKEAIALGLAVDRKAAAKIEIANDAITRMKAAATGLGRTIAIKLAPVVTVLAESFTAIGTSAVDMGRGIASGMQAAVGAIGRLLDFLATLKTEFTLIKAAAQQRLLEFVQFLSRPLAAFGLMTEGMAEFIDALRLEVTSGLQKAAQAMKEFAEKPPSEALGDWFEALNKRLDETAQKIADAAKLRAIGPRPAFVDELAEPAIIRKDAQRPQIGLRSLTELGGTAGARAVARNAAARSRRDELAELRGINKGVQQLVRKRKGMKP